MGERGLDSVNDVLFQEVSWYGRWECRILWLSFLTSDRNGVDGKANVAGQNNMHNNNIQGTRIGFIVESIMIVFFLF